mgnify:CR=1 FL=1
MLLKCRGVCGGRRLADTTIARGPERCQRTRTIGLAICSVAPPMVRAITQRAETPVDAPRTPH